MTTTAVPFHVAAFEGASTRPYWLDRPTAPARRPPLRGPATCDLAIVGGG